MATENTGIKILVMLPKSVPMTNVLIACSEPASVQILNTDGSIHWDSEAVDITEMAALGMATKASK